MRCVRGGAVFLQTAALGVLVLACGWPAARDMLSLALMETPLFEVANYLALAGAIFSMLVAVGVVQLLVRREAQVAPLRQFVCEALLFVAVQAVVLYVTVRVCAGP